MTRIVGVVDEGRVILGADSAASCEDEIYRLSENKVFCNGSYVIGVTGSYKLRELLRFKACLPDPPESAEDLKPFLVRHLMPVVAEVVRAEGVAHDGGGFSGHGLGLCWDAGGSCGMSILI